MATKLETLVAATEGRGCLGKAHADEPVFVLRAQDSLSDELVELWALRAKSAGCDNDKVQEAMECAEQMRRWHTRRYPT